MVDYYSNILPKNLQSNPSNNLNYCELDIASSHSVDKHNIPIKTIILIAAVIFIFGALVGYLTLIRPKVFLLSALNKLIPRVEENIDNIRSTGTSLNKMVYTILEETPTITIPKSAQNSKKLDNVAGVNIIRGTTGAYWETLRKVKILNQNLISIKTFGTSIDVLGVDDLEDPYTQHLRKIKRYADEGNESVTKTKKGIVDTKLYLIQSDMTISDIETTNEINKFKMTNSETEKFINEIDKIFAYQSIETGVTINAIPMLGSYLVLIYQVAADPTPTVYLTKLKDLQSTNTNLKNQLITIANNRIPEGYLTIHNDNIKFFDYIDQSMNQINSAIVANDATKFIASVKEFGSNIEPLITKSATSSISYWKDNKYINQYNSIFQDYSTAKSNLSKIKSVNDFPMIDQFPVL